MSRRWRGVGQRRTEFWQLPPEAATSPASFGFRGQDQRRLFVPRRGEFQQVPAAAAPAAPTGLPGFVRARTRPVVGARRGRWFGPTWDPPFAPDQYAVGSARGIGGERPAWKSGLPRRGVFHEPPWPQAAAAAAAVPPVFVAARRRLVLFSRRGEFQPVVAGYGIPAAFGFRDQISRRLVAARRGQFHEPPWPQVAAPAAPAHVPVVRRFPRRLAPPRPGVFYGPTWDPPFAPDLYSVGAARGIGGERPALKSGLARRGTFHEPPWAQVSAQPSVWRPSFTRATNRLAGRPTRRGAFHDPPWPQGPQTVWRPERTRQTPRLAGRPTRRGNYHEPPWPQGPQAAPWLPSFLRHRPRPVPAFLRRGQYHEPRWVEGPQTIWRPPFRSRPGSRYRFAAKLRRGACWFTPVPLITTPPPRWVESATGGIAGRDSAAGGTSPEGAAGGVAVAEGVAGGVGGAEGSTGGVSITEGGTGV